MTIAFRCRSQESIKLLEEVAQIFITTCRVIVIAVGIVQEGEGVVFVVSIDNGSCCRFRRRRRCDFRLGFRDRSRFRLFILEVGDLFQVWHILNNRFQLGNGL